MALFATIERFIRDRMLGVCIHVDHHHTNKANWVRKTGRKFRSWTKLSLFCLWCIVCGAYLVNCIRCVAWQPKKKKNMKKITHALPLQNDTKRSFNIVLSMCVLSVVAGGIFHFETFVIRFFRVFVYRSNELELDSVQMKNASINYGNSYCLFVCFE